CKPSCSVQAPPNRIAADSPSRALAGDDNAPPLGVGGCCPSLDRRVILPAVGTRAAVHSGRRIDISGESGRPGAAHTGRAGNGRIAGAQHPPPTHPVLPPPRSSLAQLTMSGPCLTAPDRVPAV